MSFVCLPFVLFVLPPQNEAEKMFRAMEQTLAKAKTLQLSFESATAIEGEVVLAHRGSIIISEGNKGQLTMESDIRLVESRSSVRVISDGKKLKVGNASSGNSLKAGFVFEKNGRATPKYFTKNITFLVSSGQGFMAVPMFLDEHLDNQKFQAKDFPTASEFKLGKREKIGGRDTLVIEYKLTCRGEAFPWAVWIDQATMLPLKYCLIGGGDKKNRSTATQTDIRVDRKIDPKIFELDAGKK